MKYSNIAAAALLPLAWAAEDFDTRKGGHLKWKIENVTAATGDAYGEPYVVYDMMLSASDNPYFGTGAENGCYASTLDALTGCAEPWDAGSYTMSTAVDADGAVLTITVKSRRAMADFAVPIADMVKSERLSDDDEVPSMTVWTYTKDGGELVAETRDLEVSRDDPDWLVPTGVEWDMASATASGIATATNAAPSKSATASSVTASPTGPSSAEPSATDAAASSSPSDSPKDEHSAATRQSALAGLVLAVGLMALAF